MEQIDLSEARKTLPKLAARAGAGETFQLMKYGKPVAQLGPIAESFDPDVKASDTAHDPAPQTVTTSSTEEVDDWGLPVEKTKVSDHFDASNTDAVRAIGSFTASGEWNPDPPSGQDPSPVKPKPKPSAPPAKVAAKPQWKMPGGLTKSQQAGGKYDR